MHKLSERKHQKREYDKDERIHKHAKTRVKSSDFEDEGYEEKRSKRKHKKKRRDSQDEEVKHHKKTRHDNERQEEPNQTHKYEFSDSKREVITVNEKVRKHREDIKQMEENQFTVETVKKQTKQKREKSRNANSSESESEHRRQKSKRSNRDKDSDSDNVKKRDEIHKNHREESPDSRDNKKRNKQHRNENDFASEDDGRRAKHSKRKRHSRENSDNSGEGSPDERREHKKHKKDICEDEKKRDERRRRIKKHKNEKRHEENSDVEEGHYQYQDSERRQRRKDRKRERGDSHDSEMDNISRPVGSRYYEVSAPYAEHQITYKESQVQLGSRYYGDDKKDVEKVLPRSTKEATNKSSEKTSETAKTSTNILSSKTGGAYIPPAKLRLMQQQISDKASVEYQRLSWEALKKSIHGSVNKVNTGNIGIIARKLFQENIIRGRGLLTRSILQAQAASPTFTNVYAALVDIINSKFPSVAELLLNRCIQQFKRCFKRNDKALCINSVTFIAHLVNQQVAHEIIVLEILTLLVETPTNDSIEVACALLKECGKKLTELSSKGVTAIFSMLLNILHEGKLEKRVQYMIEVLAQIRKDNFKDFPDVIEELDLVPEEDKFTHLMTLDGVKDTQDILNVFQFDPEYQMNEEKYQQLKTEILGDEDEDEDGDDEEGDSDEDSDEAEDKENKTEGDDSAAPIIDNTETNLVALRRIIYLTIHSSLDFEECAHKLLKMQLKPGQESELCHMFLDCCAEQRTYEKFFGLLAQRFCQINRIYVAPLEQIFRDSYATVHRLDINKLRNVAKFFAHQLFTDAIGWHVLSCIHLNEEETTSSGRIFIKILFQELSEYMGLSKLNQKIKDPLLAPAMEGVFPRDNPKNTRFAINFFTSIGLGGLTDELREHLKSQPKAPLILQNLSSPSSTSSSTSSSSSSSSSSESSSSEEERERRKKEKTKKRK